MASGNGFIAVSFGRRTPVEREAISVLTSPVCSAINPSWRQGPPYLIQISGVLFLIVKKDTLLLPCTCDRQVSVTFFVRPLNHSQPWSFYFLLAAHHRSFHYSPLCTYFRTYCSAIVHEVPFAPGSLSDFFMYVCQRETSFSSTIS